VTGIDAPLATLFRRNVVAETVAGSRGSENCIVTDVSSAPRVAPLGGSIDTIDGGVESAIVR
jgi:hypothetical protein